MKEKSRDSAASADAVTLRVATSETIVVPAGMVVEFELIGGGGAGGHWGGERGSPGSRVVGVLPAAAEERTFVAHCGGGGKASTDVRGGGPALGGEGGTGYASGGAGGWGSNWSAGGGGGGGAASAFVATDGSIRIVAPGGGGGGGGGEDPGEPDARAGSPGAGGHPDGTADHPGMDPPGGSSRGDATMAAGGNGTSRRRIAGGGGGGGGGGATPGSGGAGGTGGGMGGRGGSGAVSTIGATTIIIDTADRTDPEHAPLHDRHVPGAGGRAGTMSTDPGTSEADPRLGSPGRDGLVRVGWAPAGRLTARLLAPQRGTGPGARDPVDTDHPARIGGVVDVSSGANRRLEVSDLPPSVELQGRAARLWDTADGSHSIAELAGVGEMPGNATERLDEVTSTVLALRQRGFLEPASSPDDGREAWAAPHGIGYDLVGAAYPLGADPAGRPGSVDLLRHVFAEDTPAHESLNRLIDTIRSTVGPDRVIWACKHVSGHLRFEFYLFADAGARHPDGLVGLLTDTIAVFEDLVGWSAPRRFAGDPTLVSFEFDVDEDGHIGAPTSIDASYNVPGSVDFVTNYELDGNLERFKSISQGFDVTYQRNLLGARLGSSRSVATGAAGKIRDLWLARIDATRACERCWVSFKTFSDGVYLSRTHVDDLIAFLDEFSYPVQLRSWVRERQHHLDHLRYDLCFDYTVAEGSVRANRTAFCGWF